MNRSIFFDRVGAAHQLVRLALPQHTPRDMTLVDETNTELQHIFGFRFGSICIVKRKLCHFVACNVITEYRRLFFRLFAFLFEVRVFVERIIRMNQKIGIEGVLLQSFFRQFRFQRFIDDRFDFRDRMIFYIVKIKCLKLRKLDRIIRCFCRKRTDKQTIVRIFDTIHRECRCQLIFP